MRRNKLERFPDMFLNASLIFCKARAYLSKATYWTTPKASQQGLSTNIRPSWKKHAKQSSLFWLQEMKKKCVDGMKHFSPAFTGEAK